MPKIKIFGRVLLVTLITIVLSVSAVSAATFVWRSATTNGIPETTLSNLIQFEHARVCANTLSQDSRLIWMARYRSTDMVLRNYFSHTTPEGKKVWNFLNSAGIKYSAAGEIITWNSYTDEYSASIAYKAFMNSSSHRSLIRSCTYTYIGVGDYKVGSKRMFTVLFIKPA